MNHPSLVILYVDNPQTSAAFYADLFECAPVESSPTFAMFILESGMKFGLWSRHTVEPATSVAGGGGEMAIAVADADAVRALHGEWKNRGLPIAQAPVDMDFGYTFVALDPDGHRLRVYAPAA